jgi:hypothetical protein
MPIMQKTGDEHFYFDGMPAGYLLHDFWRWQASDLLNNALRGVLAEFIVAKALGVETESPRVEWAACDLLFCGYKIEVKAAAYVQSWEQQSESALRFSIRPARGWDSENGYSNERVRHSDIYIFCVLAEKNREAADPLILDQWEFYPVLTEELNAALPNQQTAVLGTLRKFCSAPCDYSALRDAVEWLLSNRADGAALERINARAALKRAGKTK